MKCLNKKVLVGLGLAAVGLLLVMPGRSAALLPVLMMMVCPLSMIFMMRGGGHGSAPTVQTEASDLPPGSPAVEDRIAALQAEVRALKEGQARVTEVPGGFAAQADAPAAH